VSRRLVIIIGVSLAILASVGGVIMHERRSIPRKVEEFYKARGSTSVDVGDCVSASDEENSILNLYDCRVSSKESRVFDVQPRPSVRGHKARLCFEVYGQASFYGIVTKRSSHGF
jgi:hypothetical protein